jgi:hypothetical protein
MNLFSRLWSPKSLAHCRIQWMDGPIKTYIGPKEDIFAYRDKAGVENEEVTVEVCLFLDFKIESMIHRYRAIHERICLFEEGFVFLGVCIDWGERSSIANNTSRPIISSMINYH